MQRLKRLNSVIDRYGLVLAVFLCVVLGGALFFLGLVLGVASGEEPGTPAPRPTSTAPTTPDPSSPPPSTVGPSDPPCGAGSCGTSAGADSGGDGGAGGVEEPPNSGGNANGGSIWGATSP